MSIANNFYIAEENAAYLFSMYKTQGIVIFNTRVANLYPRARIF